MSTELILKASQWLNFVQHWVLPGVCVVCGKPSGRNVDLCPPCQQTLIPIERPCATCALPLPSGDYASRDCGRCLSRPKRLARTVAAFAYREPASSLIGAFKYRAALQTGRVLGSLLAERLQDAYQGQAMPQLLIPVPLHPARLRERGFNQALVLARQLGATLKIPVAAEGLARIRHTPQQQGLSARERKRNLRGAFRLEPGSEALHVDSIALIDDVVTTMSTMHELARVLRPTPVTSPDLHVWCLARA